MKLGGPDDNVASLIRWSDLSSRGVKLRMHSFSSSSALLYPATANAVFLWNHAVYTDGYRFTTWGGSPFSNTFNMTKAQYLDEVVLVAERMEEERRLAWERERREAKRARAALHTKEKGGRPAQASTAVPKQA